MTEQERIRVVVVDDHAVVRGGIEYSLMALDDIDLVGTADSGTAAMRLCEEVQPDVVLMDMMMPEINGVVATRAILQRCPQARVIALTSFQEGSLVQEALQAGAISYLLKDVSMEELAQAIRSAHAGKATLAPEAAQALAEAATHPQDPGYDLTDRERQVLDLIADGKSNAEIADELSVSLSTARFHVSTILSKLGATNRAEAAALAVKHQLVS
ncbi:MAG: response regulator transcription factor [Anaerolineae bacterium]|jgi:NarL family two-component system response regulator LiaR